MKRLFMAAILTIIALLCGCTPGAEMTTPDLETEEPACITTAPQSPSESLSESTLPPLEMTQMSKDILSKMCLAIPAFTNPENFTDDFMRSFLFGAYTSGGFSNWSDDGITYAEDTFWISEDTAESLVLTTFGCDYDVSRLACTEDNAHCYCEGSSLIISPSDFGDVWFEFSEIVQKSDRYAAIFLMKSGSDEDTLATHTLYLLPADNSIGFIVTGVSHGQ